MTKPTLTTLAIGLLVLASSASFSQDTLRNKKPTEISIIEAIENEMLDVVVSGSYDSRIFREVVDANGIYYGKCMSIVLKSKIDTFVLLRLDCGMKLVPSDTFFQTMIATKSCSHNKNCEHDVDKLDGVGPVDNRPSTDKLHHFVNKKKKLHVTRDM